MISLYGRICTFESVDGAEEYVRKHGLNDTSFGLLQDDATGAIVSRFMVGAAQAIPKIMYEFQPEFYEVLLAAADEHSDAEIKP